jgi:hypothetical protein
MAERAAFTILAILAIVPAAVAFAESYRGLYEWAIRHALGGFWAYAWPAQVDVFIAAGELALFVAIIRRWRRRDMIAASVITGVGLAVSVAGNVGHLAVADWASRATAAVPPLAAAAALAVGLAVLKRVTDAPSRQEPERAPVAVSVPVSLPGVREIQRRQQCSPVTAKKIRDEVRIAVKAASNGHGSHA